MTKCIHCGAELKEKKKAKMKVVILNEIDQEFIRESNNIEGEYSDIAFEDACEAYRWAYQNIDKPIDLDFILQIHYILMKRLNHRIAGSIRSCQVYVGNRECLHYLKIVEELNKLCIFKPENETAIKDWHIRFEEIHPFEDGNGRTGRILMNIQRLRIGLPILIIYDKEKQEYYKWFRELK